MIKYYFNLSPNPMKVALCLEEMGLPYQPVPVDTRRGQQFDPAFLAINPNGKVPAIVDGDATVFDSNAILLYLAEKTGRFIPSDLRGRAEVLQWLFWQMAGLGPMAGQNHHFVQYAPERLAYAVDRYVNETNRLYGVLDQRLADRPFVAGEAYSIADMACYPWTVGHERQGQNLDDFPNLKRWFRAVEARPATVRAYEAGKSYQRRDATVDEEAKKILFGQTAANIRY